VQSWVAREGGLPWLRWRCFSGFQSRNLLGFLCYVIYSVCLQVLSYGAQGLLTTVFGCLCLVWTGTTASSCSVVDYSGTVRLKTFPASEWYQNLFTGVGIGSLVRLFTSVGSLEYYRISSLGYIQCQVTTTSSSSSTFDQIVVFWLATSFDYAEHMQVIENCRAKFCLVPRLTSSSTVNWRRGFRSCRLRVPDSGRPFPTKHISSVCQEAAAATDLPSKFVTLRKVLTLFWMTL
jgi:hypothetical protein